MRTFLIVALLLSFSSLAPTALAAECQPGYVERSDGTGCDKISTGTEIQTTPKNEIQTTPRNTSTGTNITLINPLGGGSSLEGFLGSILDVVIRIGTIIVILMLVFVGYKFVVARGDPGEITKAKDNLLWTVVGALILLGAKAIALGIEATVKALSVGQ